MSLELSKLPSK